MCKAVKLTALAFLFFLTFFHDALSLTITPERAAITLVNESYATNASINVRRIRKGGDYVDNMEGILKVPIGNNVTIDLVFYEYLHNEYRKSFVEMHYKLCDLIHHDPYLGLIVRRAGLVDCPMQPGKLSLRNIILSIYVPSVWPFEKGKGEVTASDNTNGAIIAKGHIIMTFKEK